MRIAITGGIAEGKSTVLNMLREMGHSVSSADDIARQLFRLDSVNLQIASLLRVEPPVSPVFVRDQMLRSHVFRRAVNRLMHRPVVEFLDQSESLFTEIPLLFETCLSGRYDQIWVVTCGRAEQIRRLEGRYGPDFDVHALLSVQLNSSVRMAFADQIIRTNCSFETVQTLLSTAVDGIRC